MERCSIIQNKAKWGKRSEPILELSSGEGQASWPATGVGLVRENLEKAGC